MANVKTRTGFAETEKGKEIRHKLWLLTEDNQYNTSSSYSANELLYPDNLMPFIDKHMNYLINHPMLDPDTYMSNIKLLTRLR